MTTLDKLPPAKSKPAFSWFGNAKPAAEAPLVLIRLRDLSQPAEVRSLPIKQAPTPNPSAFAPEPEAEFATLSVVETPAPSQIELAATPPTEAEPEVDLLSTEFKAAAETTKSAASSSEPLTPAKRQRQRREAKPAKKNWTHTIWQGAVGLLLVLMFVGVYLVMAGGKKGDAVSADGNTADGAPQAGELESPEVLIPEAGTSAADLALSPAVDKVPDTGSAFEMPASPDVSAEAENTTEGYGRPPAHDSHDSSASPQSRDAFKPRSEANNYPVTPAQATYPVTDPGKYRYPDDTRPSDPSTEPGTGQTSNKPVSRGGEWNENERVSIGQRGLPDQPPTRTR